MDWATIFTRLQRDPNDQPAWDSLEAAIRRWAVTRLRGLSYDIVEDAVADMCASVVLDLDHARGPETFRGFVLGKCLNVAKRAYRVARLERHGLDGALQLPSSPPTPDDPRYAVLDECLEHLPARDRVAVELRYFADAPASRIARELRVSEGNARRIVFNGVNRLRRCAEAAVGLTSSGRGG